MNEAQLREFIRNIILNDPVIRSALTPTITIDVPKIKSIVQVMLDDQVQLLDVLKSGDVEDVVITKLLALGGLTDVEEAIGDKEDKLSNPSVLGRFLTSTVDGVKSWEIPIAEWGSIQGDITSQNDLVLEFQKKEDDLQNPTADGMVLASTVAGERSWKEIITEWGDIQGNLSDQADLVAEFTKHFLKTEHVDVSLGAQDHGKPVVLNAGGKLDQSMVVAVDFIPQGEFTPTAGTEYPTGTQPFEVWRIGGLTVTGYDYLTGTLAGRTAFNDNILLYLGSDQWALFVFDSDTSDFYLLDGTRALTAPFNAGNQRLSLVADGVDGSDAVTIQQAEAGLNLKLNKAGDTMTGDLTIGTGADNSGHTLTLRGNDEQWGGQQRLIFRRPDDTISAVMYGSTGSNFLLIINDEIGDEVGRYTFVNGNITVSAEQPFGDSHLTRRDYVIALVELHANLKINPHEVTKAQVGLGSVDNTSDANKPISDATATALAGKAPTVHTHTKDQVGLSNVDNTSDASKPLSSATTAGLATKPTGAWTFDGTTLNITVS